MRARLLWHHSSLFPLTMTTRELSSTFISDELPKIALGSELGHGESVRPEVHHLGGMKSWLACQPPQTM